MQAQFAENKRRAALQETTNLTSMSSMPAIDETAKQATVEVVNANPGDVGGASGTSS